MTKQELIDHLQHLEQYTHYSEDAPALREAIEMLRCSEIPNSSDERTDKRTETHACDLISRQDAITEFSCCELTPDGGIDANYAIDFLKHLPSVQPDSKKLSFTHKALDTISRQAAIDALHMHLMYRMGTDSNKKRLDDWINGLPSAQPEQRWIPTKVKPDPDLPEDDMSGYFLVTLHTYGNIGFDMDEYEVKKMRWDRVNGWVFPVHSPAWIEEALTQEVLAWKPCPEPYREDGVE